MHTLLNASRIKMSRHSNLAHLIAAEASEMLPGPALHQSWMPSEDQQVAPTAMFRVGYPGERPASEPGNQLALTFSRINVTQPTSPFEETRSQIAERGGYIVARAGNGATHKQITVTAEDAKPILEISHQPGLIKLIEFLDELEVTTMGKGLKDAPPVSSEIVVAKKQIVAAFHRVKTSCGPNKFRNDPDVQVEYQDALVDLCSAVTSMIRRLTAENGRIRREYAAHPDVLEKCGWISEVQRLFYSIADMDDMTAHLCAKKCDLSWAMLDFSPHDLKNDLEACSRAYANSARMIVRAEYKRELDLAAIDHARQLRENEVIAERDQMKVKIEKQLQRLELVEAGLRKKQEEADAAMDQVLELQQEHERLITSRTSTLEELEEALTQVEYFRDLAEQKERDAQTAEAEFNRVHAETASAVHSLDAADAGKNNQS